MSGFVQVSLQKRGAAAIDSYELSEAFCRARFFHAVILSDGNELKSFWAENEFRRIIWVKTFSSNVWSWLFWTAFPIRLLGVLRAIHSLDPKTILATHFHPWLGFIFRRFSPAKKMLVIHESPFSQKERNLAARLQQQLLKRSDVLITHSEFIRQDLLPHTHRPVAVMPLGAYDAVAARFPRRDRVAARNFLFFGRILPYKGLDNLVDAFVKLSAKNSDLQLTIAGQGRISPQLCQKITWAKITLINHWLSLGEIAELVGKSDVVAVPYSQASQSGVISLAAGFGAPVVASRAGGLGEQVQDGRNGLLFEPGNAGDLAEKMERLYNDPKLYRQLVRGVQEAKEGRGWDKAAEILMAQIQ
jgi:glycosyltransferase involved in cell wall biosynthesis